MSSFILSNKSTAAIAALLDRSVNTAHWTYSVCYGIYSGDCLYSLLCKEWSEITGRPCFELNARRIYAVLRRMNENAYGERYHRVAEAVATDMPYGEWLATCDRDPWQMLKTFECFLYQCNEGSTGKSELCAALTLAKDQYMKYLIGKLPAYSEAFWG